MSQSSNKASNQRQKNCLPNVVLFMLCLALTFLVLFSAVPNFKANVCNLMLNVFEGNEEPSAVGSLEVSEKFCFTPHWLPDGCVQIQEEESIDSYYQYYEDESGNSVFIQKIFAEGQVITLDTENAEMEDITLRGCEGTIIVKGTTCQIIWLEPQQNMCIVVSTEGFTSQDTLRIAENLEP